MQDLTGSDILELMNRPPLSQPRLRIRIVYGGAEMVDPSKAELLKRRDRASSIVAAGREIGMMSYKRV